MSRMIDLTGQRFGMLVAIKPTDKRSEKGTSVFWLCKCDCGNEKEISAQSLRKGRTTSCGCQMGVCRSSGVRKSPPQKNISGRRFGRLVAIKPTGKRNSSGETIWLCACDCGKNTETSVTNLIHGDTQSCGCLKRERIIASRYVDSFREKQRAKSLETWDQSAKAIGMQDDTNISIVKSKKARSDSSTGKRGVFKKRENQFYAQLTFQKKIYREYGFKTVEEAEKARERLWETYVLPYLESVGEV